MKHKKILLAGAAALLAGSVAWASIGYLKTPQPAPKFTINDLNGKTVRLDDFKGRVVLVMFWATWCGPCRMEIPHLIEFQKTYQKEGLEILALSVSERSAPEALAAFVKRNNITYRVVPKADQIAQMYDGFQSIPTSFLVDRAGNLRVKFVGAHPKQDFEREIVTLLKERAPAKPKTAAKPKAASPNP